MDKALEILGLYLQFYCSFLRDFAQHCSHFLAPTEEDSPLNTYLSAVMDLLALQHLFSNGLESVQYRPPVTPNPVPA